VEVTTVKVLIVLGPVLALTAVKKQNHPPVVMTIPNMLHLALVGQEKVIVPIAT